MRLRVCIMLAALAGAAGSMILAADMYRRLAVLECSAIESASSARDASLVFGTAHVLGTAGMGVLFLAISLLLFAEKKSATSAEHVASSSTSTEQVDEALEISVAIPLDKYAQASEDHPLELPAATLTPIQADQVPALDANGEEISTPIPLTEDEFRRTTIFEKVLQEQGEVPFGTPIENESEPGEAVPEDGDEAIPKPKSPLPPPEK